MSVTGRAVALSVGEFGAVGEGEGAIIKFDVFYVIFFSSVYPGELRASDVHIGEIKVSYAFDPNVGVRAYIDVYRRCIRHIHNNNIEGHILN